MGLNAKQIGWIVAGLVVIGVSYYIGFVGWTETKMMTGDQGYGLYEVTTTYPIAGIVGFLFGLGLMGNAFGEEEGADAGDAPLDPSTVDSETEAAGNGGAPLDEAAGQQGAAAGELVCPDCGASIDPRAEFCTSCGEEIPPEVA